MLLRVRSLGSRLGGAFTLRVIAAYAASRLVVLSGFALFTLLLSLGVPGADPPRHVTALRNVESRRWLRGEAELSLPPPDANDPTVLALRAYPVTAPLDATVEVVGQPPVRLHMSAGAAVYRVALSDSLVAGLRAEGRRLVVRVTAPEISPFEASGGASQDQRNLAICLEGLGYGTTTSRSFDLADDQYFPQGSHPVESSAGRGAFAAFFRNAMMQWDAGWYRQIAAEGYAFSRDRVHTFQNAPFYPLYPLASRWTARVTGLPLDVSMLVIANLLAILGVVTFAHLARAVLGEDGANASVLLLCFFPQSLFLSLPYTESCMLVAFSLFLLMLHRRRHLAAAIVCGVGSACRPTGPVLVPALVLSFLGSRGWRDVRHPAVLLRGTGLALIGIAGLLAYSAYLGAEFGDPLAFSHAHAGWKKELLHDPVSMLSFSWVVEFTRWGLAHAPFALFVDPRQMEAWSLVGTLLVLLAAWRRLPAPWIVAGMLIVLVPYTYFGPSNVGLTSMARYASVNLPLFLALGSFLAGRDRQLILGALVGLFATGLLACSVLFAHGRYFVG